MAGRAALAQRRIEALNRPQLASSSGMRDTSASTC